MTNIMVEALYIMNQHALINRGWAGMGQCTDSLSFSPYLLATLLSRTHFSKEVVKSMSVQM
jgi:hypothetical protein